VAPATSLVAFGRKADPSSQGRCPPGGGAAPTASACSSSSPGDPCGSSSVRSGGSSSDRHVVRGGPRAQAVLGGSSRLDQV